MEEMNHTAAIIVGIAANTAEVEACEVSLSELERLLDTAGAEVFSRVIQVKQTLEARTLIGSGKVAEIRELCKNHEIGLVVFDTELSPSQIRNLEEDLDGVKVIDRSMLILDIFALHATSGEGKLQVELAQLKYTAPRLIGHGGDLSRQGGGIGSRGPGESKLETDKRHLKERIHTLETQLREMEHNRSVMRRQRDQSGLTKIAIVGYTNAGKSTLLNCLTDAGVLSEDKLFATLDPTTRRMMLPSGENVLLTDTVGFIRKLPHHLVEAFKSTLDEVRLSDILMIVADITDPEVKRKIEVTEEIIKELSAEGKPTLYVYNKCDAITVLHSMLIRDHTVAISAKSGEGIDRLLSALDGILAESKKDVTLCIPYDRQSALSLLYKEFIVSETDYRDDGVYVKARLDARGLGMYSEYILNEV